MELDYATIGKMTAALVSGGGLTKLATWWAKKQTQSSAAKAVAAEATDILVQSGLAVGDKWREQAEALGEEVRDLKKENAALRESLEKLRRSNLQLESKMASLQVEIKHLSRQLGDSG